MTEDRTARVADVLIAAAAIGAAYYIVKTPPLRRIAWRLTLAALTGTIPAWFSGEVRRAWTESGAARSRDMMSA